MNRHAVSVASNSKDPNIAFLEQTIFDLENELSAASFGDRTKIPLLMKQLKEARRILTRMNGEA